MGQGRLERLAPLAGAAFAVVFAIGLLTSDTPDTSASGEEIIAHYDDSGTIFVTIFALLIAAVLFMFFASVLREVLHQATGAPEWLASTVYAGAIIFTVALAIFGMTQIMLIDASDLKQPEVAQALNIFDNDNFMPAVVGITLMYLATGWHVLRSGLLPKWLAWVSVVLGVACLAGPAGFVAFLAFPIWVLIVSVLLYQRQGRTAPAGAA